MSAPHLPLRGRPALLPALLLLALAAAPLVYRAYFASRALQLTKVALVAAFSGQLQGRGADLYAASQLALADANRLSSPPNAYYVLTALDDQGRPAPSAEQARAAAADPGVRAVLCCTTTAALAGVAALLPPREPLLPLLPAARAEASAEAELAARQFGSGPTVLVSDVTIAGDARAELLEPALTAAGFSVTSLHLDFAAGDSVDQLSAAVANAHPGLVVLDADYPAGAVLGKALRAAGVDAPLLGDDRLDGAPAAALLAGLDPWWYVAPDRAALLRLAPATFAATFRQQRGHEPSSRDVLSYAQTRQALGLSGPAPDMAALPTTLYEALPGRYPGSAHDRLPAAGPTSP